MSNAGTNLARREVGSLEPIVEADGEGGLRVVAFWLDGDVILTGRGGGGRGC